jgi:hypothetical protein
MFYLETLWAVFATNWWMILILVVLVVLKVLGPQLRKFWRGGL